MSLRPSITGIDLKKFKDVFGPKDESIIEQFIKQLPIENYRTPEFRGGHSYDYFGREKKIPIEELEREDEKERQKIIQAVRCIIMGDVPVYHEKEAEEKESILMRILGGPMVFFGDLGFVEFNGILRIFQYPIHIIGLVGTAIIFIVIVIFGLLFYAPRLLLPKNRNLPKDESMDMIEAVGYLADTQEIFCPKTCTSTWKHPAFEVYRSEVKMSKRINRLFTYLQFGRPFFSDSFDSSWSYYAYLTNAEAREFLDYMHENPIMISDPDEFGKDLELVISEIVKAQKDLWLYAA